MAYTLSYVTWARPSDLALRFAAPRRRAKSWDSARMLFVRPRAKRAVPMTESGLRSEGGEEVVWFGVE